MAEDPDAELLAPSEPPLIDLFMTVVKVANWWTVVRWYTDTLGLAAVLLDRQNEFALLAAGQSRVGLQGMKGAHELARSSKVRLVFQVRDVDVERQRLVALGLDVTMPHDNGQEGYREIRLRDPDGNRLTLFAWTDPARSHRLGSNGQKRLEPRINTDSHG